MRRYYPLPKPKIGQNLLTFAWHSFIIAIARDKIRVHPCDCRAAVRAILYPWLFICPPPLQSRRVERLFICVTYAITRLPSIVNIL